MDHLSHSKGHPRHSLGDPFDVLPTRISSQFLMPLLNELTFTRTSARTNPETGAEIASGTAYTPTLSTVTPTAIEDVSGSAGYYFRGQHPDGRYLFVGPSGTYASADGLPPYTLISSASAMRVTPAGTLLTTSGTPAVIARVPGPGYNTSTNVLTFDRGYPASQGVSGISTSWGASGMNYAADGDTIWLSEYGNTDIKDTEDPPRSLWRSDDDGRTWTRVEQWPAISGTHHHTIYYDVPTGNLYCSLGDGAQANRGIWKSTDRGDTWTKIKTDTQPVSAMRFGDHIVWGSDTTPTHVLLHDPTDDTFEFSPVDYQDTALSIGWTGVVYYLGVVNGILLAVPAQGHESYHSLMASDDGRHWYRLVEMDSEETGWSKPVLLADGSLLLSPGDHTAPTAIRLTGIAKREQLVIATDLASTSLRIGSTTPMADGYFLDSNASFVDGGGPGGMRAVKIGFVSTTNDGQVPVTVGVPVEWTLWARNPLGLANILFIQLFWKRANGTTISNSQRTIDNSLLHPTEWRRIVHRMTPPAEAVGAVITVNTSGFTFNASTAYYEIAGVTLSTTFDADVEVHDRAAESALYEQAVGATWAVYDRCHPRWDWLIRTTDVTLMTLTNIDTDDTLTVIYNATTKALELTDGAETVSSNVVRCHGQPRGYIYSSGAIRRTFSEIDALAFSVRVNAGVAELVVWEPDTRTVAVYDLTADFAPANVRVTFPASGVMHLPHLATRDLTDAQVFKALMGIA